MTGGGEKGACIPLAGKSASGGMGPRKPPWTIRRRQMEFRNEARRCASQTASDWDAFRTNSRTLGAYLRVWTRAL